MEFKSTKRSKILKINGYDFGFSYAKGTPTLVALFFGKIGIMFSIPFGYCVLLRKKEKRGE